MPETWRSALPATLRTDGMVGSNDDSLRAPQGVVGLCEGFVQPPASNRVHGAGGTHTALTCLEGTLREGAGQSVVPSMTNGRLLKLAGANAPVVRCNLRV